jgi:hypothetical protein
LSKSHRNLAENPRASLLMANPVTHEEFRADLVFEQTLRRGPIFDRLRRDLAMIAALTGMQDVFRLAGADVYRVTGITRVVVNDRWSAQPPAADQVFPPDHAALGELCGRLSRCSDLDTFVEVLLAGLDELLGYEHSMLLLVDEAGERLFTIGSHGYAEQGVGSEIAIGDGLAGQAATLCAPVRADPLVQMAKYARTVRTAFEGAGRLRPSTEIAMPGLSRPGSQLAIPAITLGELVGVLLVESELAERFGALDEAVLSIVASLVASMVQSLRSEVVGTPAPPPSPPAVVPASAAPIPVRHFAVDGSTFVGGSYLIKGVAGRLLWSLLRHHARDGRTEFSNREMRLDLSLDLPDFRDNFESRLILLKRRLDEREAPMRIVKTGRGRFRLELDGTVALEEAIPG